MLLTEYEVAFDKFATDGVLQYNDIKKFFESVGHVPSQKEIDEAIEIVTKSKRRAVKFQFVVCHGAVRALGSHQCGLGSILAQCLTWVEFVVGSRPCSEGFCPVFLPP